MHKIYLFEHVELVTEEFVEWALPLLPEERRKKALSYRQDIDRKNCVISYLLLKIALKECFRITDFSIVYGKYGKPYIAEYANIFFSISHCRCGCIVAVADFPIGVDIQNIVPFSWEIAMRVCCKEELEVLKKSADKALEFTRMWSAKESYAKMTGEGISIGLNGINTLSQKYSQIMITAKYVISVALSRNKKCDGSAMRHG
ncbi:MAG: 4'-phosphopantetheinyl transferase family protein [Bacteroides sp.]